MLYLKRYGVSMETIVEFLRKKLRDAGASRFEAIAAETGVAVSFIRKFAYNSRDNPRVQTIQPLLDLFLAVERGERALPEPVSSNEEKAA